MRAPPPSRSSSASHPRHSLFASAEYGPGAGVLRLDGSKLVDVWTSDETLSNHYATSVGHEGYLYGFHGRQEFGQSFVRRPQLPEAGTLETKHSGAGSVFG